MSQNTAIRAAPPRGVRRGPGIATTILDRALPSWDATRVEHRVIDASPTDVYQVALHVDFLDAVRENLLVKALLALRAALERVVSMVLRRPMAIAAQPDTLRLIDLPRHGQWVCLGRDPPREIAFGVIGRFWAGETAWKEVDAGDFPDFEEPGFARIACNLLVLPAKGGGSVLVYEARTRATDASSRRAFMRYWRVVSPFVGVVMRSLLKVVEREAVERGPRRTAENRV